ncbi:PDZ domain-containing protein [Salmonella sp. S146_54837]|uniref:PDZ domain-containing protein n=2 Tax=unclassified Salmonella TaxID=2614656 RepID=UPI0034D5720E
MRGGPPWGFRVEGNGSGHVFISSLRQRSSGKDQQILLGDEVISINDRSMQGLSGDVAMSIVENSVGILELEILRKRYEDGPVTDFTSSAYSHPKIQSPQPTYQQPQVYQPPQQPTYQQQSYQNQPYQNSYPQAYQPHDTYKIQPYTPHSPSQPSYQSQPGYQTVPYQESNSSVQPHVVSTMNNHVVQHKQNTGHRSPHTVEVSETGSNQSGGGLTVKKKTTTTTRVLTKSGGDKSERTVTKTVTERVGNQETTTTTKETQSNDGYGEELGPKSVVKETRYTDDPIGDLMEVAPASQSQQQTDSRQPQWTKKTPPWEAQRKKRPVPPPPVKPKPKVPLPASHTDQDMERFQSIRYSPSGSPTGGNTPTNTPTNYNAKPRGWNSPRNSIDYTPTSPRSVESGNAGDFRSQPLVQDPQRKGSDGFTDFNARPKGFHPSNFTPRAGMVE